MTNVKLAKELISLETVDGNYKAFEDAWQLIDAELDTFKYQRYMSNEYESRVYFANGKKPDFFDVMLNLHLDVVPGPKKIFTPKVKGDKLYGRGAYDMKAAGAVFINLFKELADSMQYKLGLQIVTDEERGGHNGTKYQFDQGLKAGFGIAGESGSNFNVKNKAKGIYWFKIDFHGTSSHAGKPWNGNNPLFLAQEFLDKLSKKYPQPTKEAWITTVTPTGIEANNQAYNKVPDKVTLTCDSRFTPKDESQVVTDIKSFLPENATMEFILSDGAHNTSDEHPYVQSLLETSQSKIKKNTLEKAHGTGDMRFYTIAGFDGVEFGPVGAHEHHEGEWVSLSSLETYQEILRDWLKNIQALKD